MTNPFGPLHKPLDDGWGLSWSERWHFIKTSDRLGRIYAACGTIIYTQSEIRDKKQPAHLLTIVDGLAGAPTCKKCVKHLENDV